MKLDARLQLFLTLAAVFVTALIVGDIIGGKLFTVDAAGLSLVISVGMIPFPVTFLITDLLNEFYGKRAARLVTWVGFGMALFAFAVIFVAVQVPWAPFTRGADWKGMNAASFANVFAGSQRILAASMIAYLVAQMVDIAVFQALKRWTADRFLWLRATGSTVVSQLIDTVLIQLIAWWGLMGMGDILNIIATSYVVKVVVAVALTPLVYLGHAAVERGLGLHPENSKAPGPSPEAFDTASSSDQLGQANQA